MRRGGELTSPPIPVAPGAAAGKPAPRSDWSTLRRLFPYLWQYKWRVLAALAFMVCAKLANVSVPLLLKELVDTMDLKPGDATALLVVPAGLLLGYGALRLSTTLFTELRELVFSKATQGAARTIALETFQHLHALSLRFHLERQTGGMTRDIERGVRGIESLISYSLYSIVPTLIEVALVLTILAVKFDAWFAWITIAALVVYIVFTVTVTEWRTQFRREANEFDSAAHTKAVDSLLNYETVKYFNNEGFEAGRYDESLQRLRRARLKSQTTLSLLNTGQQVIIAVGLVAMLWRATMGVAEGRMTLGDLVMVNAFMIQLYIPLNFLGVLYREIKQSLTDLDKMFTLMEKEREIADRPEARPLLDLLPPAAGRGGGGGARASAASPWSVRFEHVDFSYEPNRQILHDVSFEIPAGKTVAVVGPSGSGKSTLARLLYRFYDVQQGRITIAGHDVRDVTQSSVRQSIGIVPQDTVLFNDTVEYNIAYGRTGATRAEVEEAARAARIHGFIESTPKGYQTMVGERGLKLSGGEKQRVAIARTLLKNPPILIFDEATSALDSANEKAIQAELKSAAQNKTTLVVAHRLSTVVDAHEILVLELGRIIERGTHQQLLAQGGRYADMWALQRSSEKEPGQSFQEVIGM
ncbi:MAG: putative type transport system involved in Fe cluster assembly, permease and ATPase [Ramlibacter sp.]|uniref:ABCB family ABC transporter ATP-binding protein/permease n=1 Tax=Ramlibacter sp. TaxID=1917967 RepID=UPI002607420F|nr:ABC transporter ATP-binding protein/permease [Ramlibacter sp.]MDB5752341.1 putative type transport system involved in Fe cluster assembly, permease and ATPase [Ramlibacter sp.]